MLSNKYATLFRHTNYRFSTQEGGGQRQSSLYYEDAHGNQGRWRREHPQGQALFYQGKSLRFFTSQDEFGDFVDYRVTDASNPETQEEGFNYRFSALFKKEFMDVRDGISNMDFSAAAVQGSHVVELCPPQYYVRHSSSGSVILQDGTAAGAYGNLQALDDSVVIDWTT